MSVETPALPDYCWPVDWSCAQDYYDDLTTMPDPDNPDGPRIPNPDGIAIAERAEALAVQSIRMLTGYKVGGCPVVLRPCSPRCIPGSWLVAPGMDGNWAGYSGWTFQPYIGTNGQWLNACGCKNDSCSCVKVEEVVLPNAVSNVTEVMIDGAVLDPSAYRVDNYNRLVRTDGGAWPTCQDMNLNEGEGTFFVTAQEGAAVDGLASYAAGVLAVEFAKACTGGKCSLPPGVVSVTRSGVTMELASGSFPTGMTGIREVDLFIQHWNPYGLRTGGAEVYSVDVPTGRRTTWKAGV